MAEMAVLRRCDMVGMDWYCLAGGVAGGRAIFIYHCRYRLLWVDKAVSRSRRLIADVLHFFLHTTDERLRLYRESCRRCCQPIHLLRPSRGKKFRLTEEFIRFCCCTNYITAHALPSATGMSTPAALLGICQLAC